MYICIYLSIYIYIYIYICLSQYMTYRYDDRHIECLRGCFKHMSRDAIYVFEASPHIYIYIYVYIYIYTYLSKYMIYKTMIDKVDYFSSITKLAEGQYKYTFSDKGPVYILWCDSGSCSINSEISGQVKATDYLGSEQIMSMVL